MVTPCGQAGRGHPTARVDPPYRRNWGTGRTYAAIGAESLLDRLIEHQPPRFLMDGHSTLTTPWE